MVWCKNDELIYDTLISFWVLNKNYSLKYLGLVNKYMEWIFFYFNFYYYIYCCVRLVLEN